MALCSDDLSASKTIIFYPCLHITCGIDNGIRKVMLKLKFPVPIKSVSKCTLAGTKFEIVIQKEEQTPWGSCGDLETNIIETRKTKKKAGDDADALDQEEMDEMPRLQCVQKYVGFIEIWWNF